MLSTVIATIKAALTHKWEARLVAISSPLIGASMEHLTPHEAFIKGQREGYWAGVLDLAELDVTGDPDSN